MSYSFGTPFDIENLKVFFESFDLAETLLYFSLTSPEQCAVRMRLSNPSNPFEGYFPELR
jgi:hypothetical protein